ncbi:MAG: glutamine synthetase III [Planctomycetes bacterium]|nr:glutamine synthetase III [Planctomycetota bacterium]
MDKMFDVARYGEDVFGPAAMREYLPADVAAKLLSTINDGAPLDETIAGTVAHAMKQWALDRGATHFTHWFLPLTGSTAEKHDAFLEIKDGQAIMSFSGKNLISSEPDASSFPSGGLRCTFEARGYTAWDPTSPAFVKRHGNGATLCIPTAFCSYNGETLDKKTPLLRSVQALSSAVKRLMRCFRQPDAKVRVTVGIEQEYFLIDQKYYLQRPDLVQTGRTIFGATPPKHQQLEDHYFGTIKTRVLNFMTEVEHELWKLGIPAKTRHNEVAPAQFELAPVFEDVNLAVDHNMLVMEILRQVAARYDLVCLMHEKPFAGVNGSGKHNNWSVSYGATNLLNPGSDPHQNAVFLTVLCAMIKAVDEHSDLLRSSVINAGNDHRLGANEAPPAIISMYLGEQLSDVIDQLEKGAPTVSRHGGAMRIGVDTLPPLPRDATDRNRTSPFAFTGNKFEFRSPGASQSCAGPCMMINTIVAAAIDEMAAQLEALPPDGFNAGLQALLQQTIRDHKRIIFNGDNYGAEWRAEAERRGLPNLANASDALRAMTAPRNVEMFVKYGVFNQREMASRYEVFTEDYHRRIHIEGQLALEMTRAMFVPAVTAEFNRMLSALNNAKLAGVAEGTASLREAAAKLGRGLDAMARDAAALEAALAGPHEGIIAAMRALRATVDGLEGLVEDKRWPLPKDREMLFLY